jgi:hypothetical protein
MDYATHEAMFEIPSGYGDASLNRLVYKRATGAIHVVVSRTPAQNKTLSQLTAIRLRDQQRALPFFELGQQSERLVAGAPTADVAVFYADADRKIYQRSASFLVASNLVLLAVQGPAAAREEIDRMFEHALGTLVFRQRGN